MSGSSTAFGAAFVSQFAKTVISVMKRIKSRANGTLRGVMGAMQCIWKRGKWNMGMFHYLSNWSNCNKNNSGIVLSPK